MVPAAQTPPASPYEKSGVASPVPSQQYGKAMMATTPCEPTTPLAGSVQSYGVERTGEWELFPPLPHDQETTPLPWTAVACELPATTSALAGMVWTLPAGSPK